MRDKVLNLPDQAGTDMHRSVQEIKKIVSVVEKKEK